MSWDQFDAIDPMGGATPASGGETTYATSPTRETFKDPRFLSDLREEYRSRGVPVYALSDDELLERFVSDGTWGQLNTVSAARDFAESRTATADERARQRRLTEMYRVFPNFWQEGGRGASGFFDGLAALAADPINLIGGVAAKGAAQATTRTALAAGQTTRQATRAGVRAGVGRAAATEGAIGAGAEATIDALQQGRDINLGLQDEFSYGQLATSAALGGGIGAGAGALISAPAALAGARLSGQQIEELRNIGLPDEQIAQLTNQQATDILTDPEARQQVLDQQAALQQQEQEEETRQAEATQPADEQDAEPDAFDESIVPADLKRQLNREIEARRDYLDRLVEDGADPEEIEATEAELARIGGLRAVQERLVREEEEIVALEQSNDPTSLAEGQRRRQALERDLRRIRTILRNPESEAADQAAEDLGVLTLRPEDRVDAPEEAAGDEAAAQGQGGEAEAAEATGEEAPSGEVPQEAAPEAPAVNATEDAQRYADEFGVDLSGLAGRGSGKDGRIWKQDVIRYRREQKRAEAEGAEPLVLRPDQRAPQEKEEAPLVLGQDQRVPAAPEGPAPVEEITPRARAYALESGIDWRDIPREEGKPITTIEVNQRLNALRESGAPTDNDYARQASRQAKQLADLSKRIIREGDTYADWRSLMELVSQAEKVRRSGVDREDLLALFDENVRVMRDNEDLPESMFFEVRSLVEESDVPRRSDVRTSSARYEQARQFTTAGQTNEGAPQSFLRQGTPIAKGSDYTLQGAQFPSASRMGFEEAMERARLGSRGDTLALGGEEGALSGSDLVPFRATGRMKIYGPNGVTTIQRGDTAFADGVTGKAVSDPQTAQSLREFRDQKGRDIRPDDREQVEKYLARRTPTRRSPKSELRRLLLEYQDDPDSLLSTLEQLQDETPTLAASETDAPTRVAEHGFTDAKQVPLTDEDGRVLIARSLLNPADARMISKKQIEGGKTLADIIGKTGEKSRVENWELGYAPVEKRTRSAQKLAELFDSPDTNKPFGTSRAKEADTNVVEAEKAATTRTAKTLDEVKGSTTRPLTETEAASINAIAPDGFKAAPNEVYDYPTLLQLTHAYELQGWKKVKDPKAHADRLAQLYDLQAEANPDGIILPNETREEAVNAARTIMGRFSPEEGEEAARLIGRLGGDKSVGPMFRQNPGGGSQYRAQYVGEPDQAIELGDAAPVVTPRLAQFYHEVAHWAYQNVLTPQDRADFWRSMSKYYKRDGSPNTRKIASSVARSSQLKSIQDVTLNAETSPQELFANMFEMWAARKMPDSLLQDESYWRRIARYVKAVFDRYVRKVSIDPDLEPLFAKILPDEEQQVFQRGVAPSPEPTPAPAPKTPKGTIEKQKQVTEAAPNPETAEDSRFADYALSYYHQLRAAKEEIESAIENEQYETLFEAMKDLNRIFLSLVPQGIGKPPFGPAKRVQKLIRQRQMGIFEIMSGTTTDDPDKIAEALVRMDAEGAGSVRIRKPEEMYAQLVAFYYDGHAPSPVLNGERFLPKGAKADPETGAVTFSYGKLSGFARDPKAAAIRSTIASTMKRLQDAYTRKTGLAPSGEVPASVKNKVEPPTDENGGTQAPTKAVSKGRKRKQRLDKATDNAAKKDASTPPKKRKTKQSTESDPALAEEVKSKSLKQLRALYRKHRGTDRGTQIAHVMVEKQKATDLENVLFERTPISKEIKNMKSRELEEAFLGAVYEGDSKLIDQTAYEMRRRLANKRLKASSEDGKPPVQIKPIISKVTEAIRRERTDNTGVASHDGVPPSARATIRELLSYMTHRDPEIEVGMRTMAYRMLNLLGKTVRDAVGEANVITANDVARLANTNPEQVGSAVFADFRAPEFKQLRADLRRMTIGLNKGEADPFDLMHELGHTLVRSGAMPEDEIEAILEAYRAANDPTKERIERLYRGKYADRSGADLERALAEEWFSENLAQYMGERVSRGDILQASIDGDITRLTMRGKFDRAIDRLVEYIAYVVNGVIGRKDIKQTFRRLMFYGDMLQTPSTRPLADASGGRIAVSPQIASAHAADVMASSPRARMQKINSYVGNGAGFDSSTGEPVVFYHGTPRGKAFDRQANPNVYLKPSPNGHMGPGIYITENPNVADEVYSKRPTTQSLEQQFEELGGYDLTEDEVNTFEAELARLHNIRQRISENRQHYTQALISLESSDPITQEILADDVGRLIEDIDSDVLAEEAIMDEMRRFGLEVDPLVMPIYARVTKPADFQQTTDYTPDDAFIRSVLGNLVQTNRMPSRTAESIAASIAEDGSVSGSDFYKMLTKGMELEVGSYSAKKALADQLQEMGYDGMETTHVNLSSVGGESMPTGGTYAAEPTPHRTLVVFDPENVKHIAAAEFDQYDARLFHRDNRVVPNGLTGGILDDLISENVESLSDIPPSLVAENAEKRGTHSGITSAMMSMLRGRDLSPDEQDVMFRAGARGLFMEQSTRMKRMGMNWIADWYKGFFPDTHQRFAKKFMPLRRKLRDLPDAHGKVRQWVRQSTASVWQEQPKSHARIVRALRYGQGSRQEKALTGQEREAFKAIRDTFRRTREELVALGIFMGDRGPDYVPQVWNKETIVNNRDDFLNAMVEYYQIERAANGQDFVQEDANKFAERVYEVLAGEDSDGVFIPIEGGTRNPQAENIDFARMIELDKYPAAMKRLEKYLESDLEAILVKYFEGTTRRAAYTERLGINGHALYDYLNVVNGGTQGTGVADGIAELLTQNKQFKKSIRFIDDSGSAEEMTLKDVIQMPFEGRETEAREFAQSLIEANASGGPSSVRRMLMEVAPTSPRGDVPQAYIRRADAIVGALADFKGQRPKGTFNELNNGFKFVENAMRSAMRKRQIGVTDAAVKTSNALRTFNNVTLLGFTTLTSLGDLALPIIRSGSMSDYVKALKNFASDPEYAELINNTGVAIENIVHDRMIHLYGGADNKLSNAFFNATMLTPWTDTMRKVAGGVGHESFKTMQRKAFKAYKPGVEDAQQSREYKTAARFLKRYGLGDFLPNGARGRQTLADKSLLVDDEVVRNAVLRFADEAIFTPNPNDIPLWAQTPIGQIVFQLKSFPLMMSRMAGYIIEEANQGNVKPLLYFATLGPAFGAGAMAAKDIVQMRGGEDGTDPELRKRNILKTLGYDKDLHGDEDDFLGWYVEGMMQMGGLGLLGDVAHNVLAQADNGAYGQMRTASFFMGPSFSAAFQSAPNVLAGAQDALTGGDNSNAKERTAIREIAQRVPVAGGVRSLREGTVDALAGEPRDGSTGGWTSDWTTDW